MKDKNISDMTTRNINKITLGGTAVGVLFIKYSDFIFIITYNTHTTKADVSSISSHHYESSQALKPKITQL